MFTNYPRLLRINMSYIKETNSIPVAAILHSIQSSSVGRLGVKYFAP